MTLVEENLLTIHDIREHVTLYEDTDHGKAHRTHIVNPPLNTHIWQPGMTMQEVVDLARFTEATIKALCGYQWVPKRNPEKYKVCENCMRIAGELMRSNGE